MNEKCSLSNLNMYLRVTGFLSLIIILIIVVYYYLQSNHSKILEKYENYALRDCKVYFTEGDTNIKNCDITQETSNYTGSCSYRFDGWQEFDTYTDNDGKTITYPKKVYTQTRTNTNDFDNPMFTNNCFKTYTTDTCIPGQPTDNCTPPEFEYNTNGIVKYDEIGKSGNSAVGNNIYGGTGYSSMQFLNTTDPRTNNINLISSICDVPLNNTLGSLRDKVFYMFEFNATTNKLENIRSVTLNSDQTTFSPVSSDNVLTNLPLRPIDASFYGLQYDATNNNLPIKIFKKNDKLRNVSVFKFNYMSYICTQSQIKNYMTARRNIYPEKFIKYGSSTIPYYSKNISISNNMKIKDGWGWSNYSSADLNLDYSDMLNTDLNTSKEERKRAIKLSYKDREDIAAEEYDTAKEVFDAASKSRTDFAINNPTFSSLIGKRNATSTASIFDYKKGYNTSSINGLNFSIPQGANVSKVGSDVCITFPYSGTATTKDYTFTTTQSIFCDILIVGGGGAGGTSIGGGGGAGSIIYATNFNVPTGTYTFSVGRGGISQSSSSRAAVGGSGISSSAFGATAIGGGGGGYYSGYNGTSGGSGGGCGGGGIGNGGNSPESYSSIAAAGSKTIGGTIIQTATFKEYLCNDGGYPRVWQTAGNQLVTSAGGGGGASGVGGGTPNNTTKTSTTGDGGNGKSYDITGTNITYGGGGGGGGNYGITSVPAIAGSGGSGGGGAGGYDQPPSVAPYGNGTNGEDGKGGGGGGSSYIFSFSNIKGGNGGSGIVILRIKINNDNIITPFNRLDTTINTFYSNEPSNTSTITIDASSIQSKILTSFVFLQKGYYYFQADINGGGYHSSMMIYSDLLLFDEANKNALSGVYNARIVYKNNNGDLKVFNKRIYIPDSKFYKLAYRYTICNTTTNRITTNFVLNCNYRAVEPALNPYEYVNLNSDVNNAIGNYIGSNNITFDGSLTDYLFCGVNLNNNYTNTNNQDIMSSLSNVKYGDNNNNTYANIIKYLDSINFFNIANLQKDMNTKKNYKEVVLPAMIIAEYGTDENIKNIQKFIDKIDDLKSNRVIVNYGSHLPTTSPSIYKEITIDEIFGKSFDRLITKERVDPLIQPPVPSTKKIYVEAVAA